MLTICASSTESQLATVTTLKQALGITGSTDDELLGRLLNAASEAVDRFVGYPILAQVYSETVAAYGGLTLSLSRTPVRAVLRLFDSSATSGATELLSSEYRVDRPAGLLQRDQGFAWTIGQPWQGGMPFPGAYGLTGTLQPRSELSPWLVEYVAGATLGGIDSASSLYSTKGGTTSTGRTLPYDLEEAAIATAGAWYQARKQDPTIQSKSVGDLSITYRSAGPDPAAPSSVPPRAQALLAPWRRSA